MIVYVISDPEDNRIILTTHRSVADYAEAGGAVLQSWDTDTPTCMITLEETHPAP